MIDTNVFQLSQLGGGGADVGRHLPARRRHRTRGWDQRHHLPEIEGEEAYTRKSHAETGLTGWGGRTRTAISGREPCI